MPLPATDLELPSTACKLVTFRMLCLIASCAKSLPVLLATSLSFSLLCMVAGMAVEVALPEAALREDLVLYLLSSSFDSVLRAGDLSPAFDMRLVDIAGSGAELSSNSLQSPFVLRRGTPSIDASDSEASSAARVSLLGPLVVWRFVSFLRCEGGITMP